MAAGLVAGIQGLAGVMLGNDQLIEAASGRLGATFLLAVLFLQTRVTLRDGLVPALDRLAAWGPFPKLAEWPSGDGNEAVGLPVVDIAAPRS